MADWRDNLRPASYRGAGFFVEDSGRQGGRRAPVHLYPYREVPYTEDLGRKERSFRLTGFVIGDNYFADRDRLIKRLESRGPGWPYRPGGILVHPFYGQMNVVCTDFEVNESKGAGRMATFRMSFVESGQLAVQPAATGGASSAADTTAAAVSTAAGATVTAGLATKGFMQRVRDATSSALKQAGAVLSGLDVFSGVGSAVAQFQSEVQTLIAQASTLATAPADLVAQVVNTVDQIFVAAANAGDALAAYENLFGLKSDVVEPGTGNQSVAANTNADLVMGLVRQTAVAGAARAAVRITFESLEEAEASRDVVLAELDALIDTAGDGAYVELQELRSVLVANVPPKGSDLPRLATLVLAQSTPALVLAYRLYGNVDRADEIVLRNGVQHPGFVPAGVELEVLTSG